MRTRLLLSVVFGIGVLATTGCALQASDPGSGSDPAIGTTSEAIKTTELSALLDPNTGLTTFKLVVGQEQPIDAHFPAVFEFHVVVDGHREEIVVQGLLAVGPGGGCIDAVLPGLDVGDRVSVHAREKSLDGHSRINFHARTTVQLAPVTLPNGG